MARGRGARGKGRGASTSGSSSRGTRSGRDVNNSEPEHEEESKDAPPAKRRKDEESSDDEEEWEKEGMARWRNNIPQSIETANNVDMSIPKNVKKLMWGEKIGWMKRRQGRNGAWWMVVSTESIPIEKSKPSWTG